MALLAGFQRAGSILAFVLAGACSAVYPEISTPARAVPDRAVLTPPPPEDLYFIRIQSASIPERTRDGRKWDAVGGAAPDPFVKVLVSDKELFRTPTQPDTLSPTWPDAQRANYRIPKGNSVRVELWDANPINNHPICVRVIKSFADEAKGGLIQIDCESGAKITMITEPAHARIGLGMRYELRTQSVFITRVVIDSPAARAGLRGGEEIIRIQSKDVKGMDEADARSLINANAPTGVSFTVKKADGSTLDVSLREGPIYPTLDDDVPIE